MANISLTCLKVAALSLKFLNPYGTNKIVLFEVRYLVDWKFFEMVIFVLLGISGGAMGAFFIKATRIWALTFRRIPAIKQYPGIEVLFVALATGTVSYWNRYTKIPVTELLLEVASPCDAYTDTGTGLCPSREQIPTVIGYLLIAFIIKAILTTITFGIKVPAGIYVPSMVVGGLFGRIVGHVVQWLALTYSDSGLFGQCDPSAVPEDCVVPGVYAMVAAGATMCGVTRLSVTLAVILFELTGSLDHVLPFSIGVLVSKWTADFIEPRSIYDLLTDMNSYPFLDNKHRPSFTAGLGDIISRNVRGSRIVDITSSPLVPATDLREKLETLHSSGELDGGLPIVRNGVLVGLIPAPDLELALDKLDNESNTLCLMATDMQFVETADEDVIDEEDDPTDFTRYIDESPVALDVNSSMDLVYECFVKLGLRYICALRDGHYAGLVRFQSHKLKTGSTNKLVAVA
jgi:chloride channel 3/4/5